MLRDNGIVQHHVFNTNVFSNCQGCYQLTVTSDMKLTMTTKIKYCVLAFARLQHPEQKAYIFICISLRFVCCLVLIKNNKNVVLQFGISILLSYKVIF